MFRMKLTRAGLGLHKCANCRRDHEKHLGTVRSAILYLRKLRLALLYGDRARRFDRIQRFEPKRAQLGKILR
jgi:hypothetical protein